MKRVTMLLLGLFIVVSLVALSDPVWVGSQLWDQDAIKLTPIGLGYPVLAVTQVIDGDTFEALLHIGPQLITAVDVRVAFPDGTYIDTPGMTGDCKDKGAEVRTAVLELLANAYSIRVTFLGWDKYGGRWDCSVTIDGEIDLAAWIEENGLTKAVLCN